MLAASEISPSMIHPSQTSKRAMDQLYSDINTSTLCSLRFIYSPWTVYVPNAINQGN